MKRFLPSEFWLLCAPIALLGAGIYAWSVLHPPPDPNSKIVLNVMRNPNAQISGGSQLSFGWLATASGGPNYERSIGFAQTLIANGDGKSQLIFRDPQTIKPISMGVGTKSSSQNEGSQISQDLVLSYDELPLWTKTLQWRGEFVSAPENPDTPGLKNGRRAALRAATMGTNQGRDARGQADRCATRYSTVGRHQRIDAGQSRFRRKLRAALIRTSR